MFVSQEKNVVKKTFQKPNILRRKPKVSAPRTNISNVHESPGTKSLVTSSNVIKASTPEQQPKPITKHGEIKIPIITKQSILKLAIANNNVEENNVNKSPETDVDANISGNIIQINNVDKSVHQSSLNIESFINCEEPVQNISSSIEDNVSPEKKVKWHLDLSNNMDIVINNYEIPQLAETEQKTDFIINVVPDGAVLTPIHHTPKQSNEVSCTSTLSQTIAIDCFSNRAVKFKCDEPDCNKGFWSEERLRKHKNAHNRRPAVRTQSRATVECPVRKALDGGGEERCPRTFAARAELLKHLDAEHSPDDAPHRCAECGRRFFWASGLRAHAQSVCARGGLACAWPGCGRVFRLPCRLREHARAHTGDRPYRCRYPDCAWAFRSASKLLRHARRHTGERRHACGACGRAFLRREHLRDHARRHHPHPGCEQKFPNVNSLYLHAKRLPKKEEDEGVYPDDPDSTVLESGERIYLVSLVPDADNNVEGSIKLECGAEAEGDGSGGVACDGAAQAAQDAEGAGPAGGAEWHAARTHCTWPLAPRHHALHDPDSDTYVLEEDVHVENAEASNVYTVRSDLFLHGNVPIDDDSQNIGGGEIAESGEAAAPLDTDLCLIDSHPTIDLMQEELMYEDAAVDESSFRVFLMNGEELT
ncbi:uncharacterized protein LOC142976014 [Anticarsia gemmatalis]|uniref:uncharacterized protein LOC142976014 n=1 Tax=Anticarsia gemmatalis TaxID=129554 RepID=UPI003F776A9B